MDLTLLASGQEPNAIQIPVSLIKMKLLVQLILHVNGMEPNVKSPALRDKAPLTAPMTLIVFGRAIHVTKMHV